MVAGLLLAGAPRLGRLGSASLLAIDLLLPGARPTLLSVRVESVQVAAPAAQVYRPAGPSCGGLVLVHGLSRHGQAHPFFERLGRALARAGFMVTAPDLPHLRAFQLADSDVTRVVQEVKALARLTRGPLGILGFSFGAGPALLAALDAEVRDRLALVGSFGGYWDLRDVIVFSTTGWFEEDGRWRRARQEEYNRWKLLAAMTPYLPDGEGRRRLTRIVDLKLANPRAEVGEEAAGLGGDGRALLALVENSERDRAPALIDSLPPAVKERLRRFSPATWIGGVRARLLIAHGSADDSIPYTESLRLAREAPVLGRVVIFGGLAHVFPEASGWPSLLGRVGDGQRLIALLDDLLGVCRRV